MSQYFVGFLLIYEIPFNFHNLHSICIYLKEMLLNKHSHLFHGLDLEFITDVSNLRWISFDAMPFVQRIEEVGASKSFHNRVCSIEMYELRRSWPGKMLQLQRLIKCTYSSHISIGFYFYSIFNCTNLLEICFVV